MATISNGIQFSGSLGNIIGYKRPGSDKNFARGKGGIPKQKIMNDPSMELTRQNASEFSGCGKAAGTVRQAMLPVAHLASPGFNINSTATKMIKAIQLLDEEGLRGRRNICLSKHKQLIEGFSLNPLQPFNSIVAPRISCNINREEGLATIQLPALHPGINLMFPWQNPAYRFILHLGVVADLPYGDIGYEVAMQQVLPYAEPVYLPWQYIYNTYTGENVTIPLLNKEYLLPSHTLLLSAGIEMGTPVTDRIVSAEKKKGCAKVIAVG